jgi:hypothetical protein
MPIGAEAIGPGISDGGAGGGGTPFTGASYDAFVQSGSGPFYQSLSGVTQPLDGVALSGFGRTSVTFPATTYGAGGLIMDTLSFSIAGLPDSSDGFDLTFIAIFQSLDGLNGLVLSGTTILPAHTPSGSFDLTHLGSSQTGTDLVWSSADPAIVQTTAGGIYGALFGFIMEWD